MKVLFTLASAGNTSNPAFCILKRKGYDLSLEITREERCFYIAFKEGRRFVGDSAPELLGLVSIWEELGDNWRDKLSDLPDIVPEIIEL